MSAVAGLSGLCPRHTSFLGARDAGQARIEAETDELSDAPWQHLGPERTARVVELGHGFSARITAAGAYPAELFPVRG